MPVTQVPRSSSRSSSHRILSSPISSPKRKKRQATVYDAVAGRVSSVGFLPASPLTSINRDTSSSTTVPNPPEEVLFRRRGAPDRYEEDDFYWADRNLAPGIELPDSDLLKAVHAYAAGFYGRTGGAASFGSLDETALMATAVLLEEWVEVVMGQKGHEVFLEGEKRRKADNVGADREIEKEKEVEGEAGVEVVAEEAREGRRRKRRKIKHDTGEDNTEG